MADKPPQVARQCQYGYGDYKRESRGQRRKTLDEDLKPVFVALVTDQPLRSRYRDIYFTKFEPTGTDKITNNNKASNNPKKKFGRVRNATPMPFAY